MGVEPGSLFLYGDSSAAARSIYEAIYDGPYDLRSYELTPVILQNLPDLNNGGAALQPVQVQPGAMIVDADGRLGNLKESVSYLPSGCHEASCAVTYTGNDPVQMDELVVHFQLRPQVKWSDGTPVTADDSVYSYEIARRLYPRVRADLLAKTQSYQALDATTVEWRSVPGYRDSAYPANFFQPLPRHAWGALQPDELFTAEPSARRPLGWGPYQIDEWTPGDHISLSRNPAYFRAGEGLPHFKGLVFRFVSSGAEALRALQSGECDLVDETAALEGAGDDLAKMKDAGQVAVASVAGTAWENAAFGIAPVVDSAGQSSPRPLFFAGKATRQAIAQCIDRERLANELFAGQSQPPGLALAPDTYVPPAHPLANPDVKKYAYDPQAASAQLQAAGWIDADGAPNTPRVAQGVEGVPDGTPFEFTYLTTDEPEKERAAQIVSESLRQCGVAANVSTQSWDALLAPGPDGPVFGRHFDMAQFAWVTSFVPPCSLYTTAEIPGPYPQYPKGWGGANAAGYSSAEFDRACQSALNSLDPAQSQEMHRQAQAIFAEDLPALPLYLRLKVIASRPDLCGLEINPSSSSLWNIEALDYGAGCAP